MGKKKNECIDSSSSVHCQVQGVNAERKQGVPKSHRSTFVMLNIKAAGVKEERPLSRRLFSSAPNLLSVFIDLHLWLCLRAGVSSPAAVSVLAQCSCGVRLVSLPALQSHPWLEQGGENLRSHVPETLLCAPPG